LTGCTTVQKLQIEGGTLDEKLLQSQLQRMLNRWAPMLDTAVDHLMAAPFSSWRALRYGWKHLLKLRGTVGAEMRRLISDERVRAALAGVLLHTGLPPDRMPVASILGVVALLRDGLFLPEGGMGTISDALAAAFHRHGGKLRLGSRVTRIVVEGGRARAVEVNGHERIDASGVISTVSPMSTFTSLVEPARVPSSFTRLIQRARLSHHAVSLQFGLANHVDPAALVNMVLPMMEKQHEVVEQDPGNVRWPVYSVPTMALPDLAPTGRSIIEMFVPLAPDVARREWTEADKQEVTESALQALQRRHDLDVAVTRVRTPADFQDQMHLYQGALYGLSPAVPPQEQFAQTSPIPGIVLAGQSTYPGYGVGPTIMSGIFAADAVMTMVAIAAKGGRG
jgi:phytoene desaturase